MVLAYKTTYDLPVLITRGSNNIGPYQYPEKVVPVFVTNASKTSRSRSTATAAPSATTST